MNLKHCMYTERVVCMHEIQTTSLHHTCGYPNIWCDHIFIQLSLSKIFDQKM